MPPIIDREKCLECEECVAMQDCPQDVFEEGLVGELATVVASAENCIGCGICVDGCAGQAITLKK